jgi:hypothetical protein
MLNHYKKSEISTADRDQTASYSLENEIRKKVPWVNKKELKQLEVRGVSWEEHVKYISLTLNTGSIKTSPKLSLSMGLSLFLKTSLCPYVNNTLQHVFSAKNEVATENVHVKWDHGVC